MSLNAHCWQYRFNFLHDLCCLIPNFAVLIAWHEISLENHLWNEGHNFKRFLVSRVRIRNFLDLGCCDYESCPKSYKSCGLMQKCTLRRSQLLPDDAPIPMQDGKENFNWILLSEIELILPAPYLCETDYFTSWAAMRGDNSWKIWMAIQFICLQTNWSLSMFSKMNGQSFK